MSKVEAIRKTLFEDYEIEFGKQLSIHLRLANEEDKQLWSHRMALKNLFLLRRIKDPGAYNQAIFEAVKDPSLIKFILDYIKSAYFGDQRPGLFGPMAKSDQENDPRSMIKLFKPIFMPDDNFFKLLSNHIQLDVVDYFKERYRLAEERNDLDEMVSLRWQIAEYQTNKSHNQLLFCEGNGVDDDVAKRLNLRTKNYMTQHVRFLDLYETVTSQDFLLKQLSFAGSSVKELLFGILKELGQLDKDPSYERLEMWSKYVNDAISVLSIRWFDSLDLEEQVNFLNRTHPLVDNKILDEITTDKSNVNFLFFISKLLSQGGYLGESEAIYRFVLRNATSDEIEHSCYSSLGAIYRDYGEFATSKEFFVKALSISERLDLYKYALELKNVGELEVHNGREGGGFDLLERSLSIGKELTAKERVGILLNLAYSYRRLGKYDEEYTILNGIISEGRLEITPLFDSVKLDPFEQVNERLSMLNSQYFMTSRFKLDYEKLSSFENENRLHTLTKASNSMQSSFQFENSRNYLRMRMRIRPNNETMLEIAQLYYAEGRYEEAEGVLLAIDQGAKNSIHQLAMGLCYVKRGDLEQGLPMIRSGIVPINDDEVDGKAHLAEYAVDQLARTADDVLLNVSIDYLIDSYVDKDDKVVFITGAASTLSNLGYFELPVNMMRELMQWDIPTKDRVEILAFTGLLMNSWGRGEEALPFFSIASELDPSSASPHVYSALAKASYHDYLGASRSLTNAIELNPSAKELYNLRDLWKERLKRVVNQRLICDDEVKEIIRSADKRFEGATIGNTGAKDFASIITDYGRAVEAMLDINISMRARDPLILKFAETKVASQSVWIKGENMVVNSKQERRSVQILIDMMNGKTISLGAWSFVLGPRDSHIYNPVLKAFIQEVGEQYTSEDIESIRRITKALSLIRNEATHPGKNSIFGIEKVVKQREKIVPLINELIQILYGNVME